MKKIIALCTLCFFVNLSAQEEVNPNPEVEAVEQDLQPVEMTEENTEELPSAPVLDEVPTDSELQEAIETDVEAEMKKEESDTEDKWYDFSEQKERMQTQRDSARALRQSDRYKMNTIMDSKRFAFGAFLEQTTKVTEIDGDPQVLLGGRFSVVFNHHLNVGLAGYGLVSPVEWVPDESLPGDYLLFGYGGLMIEPVFAPQNVVHFSVPVLLGAGGYGTRDRDFDTYDEGDAFWVFEPGINMDIKIASFFVIGLGGSFRFVSNGIQDNIDLEELSGPNAHLSFKLGWF